ncbi:MAG TPA: hypothetical protein VLF79_03760 [Candidatus Saccharimonadales bacterium]|nr:hypothetical protein [Candidatus Saccharimonadales bacterium]
MPRRLSKYNLTTPEKGNIIPILVLIFFLIGIGLIGLNFQSIQDWIRLRGYQPPNSVSQLADQDTMNAYTKHLFYLNKPQLLNSVESFRQNCPDSIDVIVLGCYHPDQNGIYLYNVQDSALSGVTQVTAAHEVLHSIYARLSAKERAALNSQLQAYYKNGLQDERVKEEVKLYQQTEPSDVLDEMSCTFGTEIAELPAPLEAYYKRYFNNRGAVVAYEQNYRTEFSTRQTAIKNDDQQLADIKKSIDAEQSNLTDELAQLNSDKNRLNSLAANNQVSDYNALVPVYNSEVNSYNQSIVKSRGLIDKYNQLVVIRNQIAGQLTTLAKAIDTRLTTQPTR